MVSENGPSVSELQARIVALEKDLDEFTAVASHDLTEPARTMAAFLELLKSSCGDRLTDEEQGYLAFVVDGSARLRGMLAALLELSRVRSQSDAFEPVDLNMLVDIVCDTLSPRCEDSEIKISHERLPEVMGDATQLRRVLSGLIENALSFAGETPARVRIAGVVESQGGKSMATISVKDFGIGIDPHFHEAVFAMFRRLHPRTETSGVGAGLAICKRIVDHHGGRIWVESTLGEGSTFRFSVPCAEDG